MRVAEIHFNHDPESAAADALNLRGSADALIVAPEWRYDAPSQPVAYAVKALRRGVETGAGDVTIKVRFGGAPPGATARIRAVVPVDPRARFLEFLAPPRGLLGVAQAQEVTFDANGESPLVTFALKGHRLLGATVGASWTGWDWQALVDGRWWTFISTWHRVCVVPDLPRPPWCQSEPDPNGYQLPWADAMALACLWAAGATTVVEATQRIVEQINAHPKLGYSPDDAFTPVDPGTLVRSFHLSYFLSELADPAYDSGNRIGTDCHAAATAVATFASILGADIRALSIRDAFDLNSVRMIGGELAGPGRPRTRFGKHEVALVEQGALPADVVVANGIATGFLVHDACLEVDAAGTWVLPVRRALGTPDPAGSGYRQQLIKGGDGTIATPKPIRLVW
jgi:hypothetical protein